MLAATVVDPLLSSPQRTMKHNDDMAALQTLQTLQLPPSHENHDLASGENIHRFQNDGVIAGNEYGNRNVDNENSETDEEEEEEDIPFQQLMNRGNFLRQLRLLAMADEEERLRGDLDSHGTYSEGAHCGGEEKKEDCEGSRNSLSEVVKEDIITIVPGTKHKVLSYESYLDHQRYYDDLKHVDIKYIDFGTIRNAEGKSGGKLIVEQDKRLGKGGFVWDAAFILGEHVIANEVEWNTNKDVDGVPSRPTTVLDLGAGTGLCGLMVAKATNSNVTVTDLPELNHLMHLNVSRNFETGADGVVPGQTEEDRFLTAFCEKTAKGTASSRVLRWGVEEDYEGAPYDVIIGADIVASLYDPVALAQTLHALSGPNTKIYISCKSRLDRPHEDFDAEFNRLFQSVTKIPKPSSRLHSPNVFIIVAEGKR